MKYSEVCVGWQRSLDFAQNRVTVALNIDQL